MNKKTNNKSKMVFIQVNNIYIIYNSMVSIYNFWKYELIFNNYNYLHVVNIYTVAVYSNFSVNHIIQYT